MREIIMQPNATNRIGNQGENMATVVTFDLSEFISTFGAGTPQLLVRRPGDRYPYPVVLTVEGDMATWAVTDTDTALDGHGQAELRWYVGDTLAKSAVYSTYISKAIVDPVAPPPPPPAGNWLERVMETASEAVAAAEAIEDMGVTVETLPAGSTATATKSVDAETGAVTLAFGIPRGSQGQQGPQGEQGPKGEQGVTFTPSVSSAGVLSWTNDGGKTNPQSVDLVAAVINALPSAVGVSF